MDKRMPRMILLLSILTLFAVEPVDKSALERRNCTNDWQGIYKIVDSKIRESNYSIKSDIDCREIKQINNYDPESVMITTGRRNRKFVICLSNEKKIPCKHIIGILKGDNDPVRSITKVFGLKRPKPKYLNESNERFFFNPKLLYGPR